MTLVRLTELATTASLLLIVIAGCRQPSSPKMSYPDTKKGDVVDDYFGTKVADPYRWMEDLDSADVAAWITAQNQVTSDYLAKLPMRERFKQRITELWNYPKVSIPVREGGRYFFQKNTGLQRQAPLYVRASLTAEPSLVLDPNVLSPDGSLSLAGGSPRQTDGCSPMRFGRRRRLANAPRAIRQGAISATRSGGCGFPTSRDEGFEGFFYCAIPSRPRAKCSRRLVRQALYHHCVGSPQSDDRLVLASDL